MGSVIDEIKKKHMNRLMNTLTVEDCLYMHNVLGLSIVCEDGHVARIADPEIDVKDYKDL